MSERDRLLARKDKLEAKLAALEKREAEKRKKDEAKRAELAGRAVLKRANADPGFAAELRAVLERTVTGRRNRALFDLEGDRPARGTEAGAQKTSETGAPEPGGQGGEYRLTREPGEGAGEHGTAGTSSWPHRSG